MHLGVQRISKICTMDGTSFVPGVLEEADNCQLKYQTTLTKPNQVKPGNHSWMLWKRILNILTISPTTTLLKQPLGKWSTKHSECEKWLAYQDNNGRFYAKETHEDTEWIIYKRTKTGTGTQLTSIDTTTEYNPSKYSIRV